MALSHKLLIGGLFLLGVSTTQLQAQTPVHAFVRALQGKEATVQEDYIGRYAEDRKELLVTIDSLGLDPQSDEEYTVSLVRADGTTDAQKPNDRGEVIFPEVSQGLATVVVTGTQKTYGALAFFLESLTAVAPDAPKDPNNGPASLPPPPGLRFPPAVEVDPQSIRTGLSGTFGDPQNGSVKALGFYKPVAANRFQVKLVNGVLQGKIIVPQDGYETQPGSFNVTILKNGKNVGTATSDANGDFYVRLNSTGVHSIIVTGPGGHAAFSFEIVDAGQTAQRDWRSTVELVAELPQASDVLNVLVVPPRMMPALQQIVSQAYPNMPASGDMGIPADGMFAPGFPGGFAGGLAGGAAGAAGGMGGAMGGGGGGGLGGPGGIGALLGIGGLAAGVAALASSDDGFTSVPASVIVP